MDKTSYDAIIIGSGAAGIMSAIYASKCSKKVLLLEKLDSLGAKLKATGGGRCNLTNTLELDLFIESFGKSGRFMMPALKLLDQTKLRSFFKDIGVESDSKDGFRVFPITHDSQTIISALKDELDRVGVEVRYNSKVEDIISKDGKVVGVRVGDELILADFVVIATGGLGYPKLGASGDGYQFAKDLDHTITPLYPAMLPLKVKEKWVANCRADTIPKVTMKIDLKKYKNLKARGDLIFTKDGIRGPVVLDFAREITPLHEKFDKVPILVNLTKGMNEDEIIKDLKSRSSLDIIDSLEKLLPRSVALEFCKIAGIKPHLTYSKIDGIKRDKLIKLLAWTPLNVVDHAGFDKAMITRGGVSLKDVNPNTLESKRIKNLYFCGEVLDLDGPCGGFNLTWSFASGALVGSSICF